jgi:hypothetical protein
MAPDNPDYLDLDLRELELQICLQQRLLGEWPSLKGVRWQPGFERGFLTQAAIELGAFPVGKRGKLSFQPILEELVTRTPVRCLDVDSPAPRRFQQFLQSPALASLTGLSLSIGALTSSSLRVLAKCPLLRDLRQLHLSLLLQDADLETLARAPDLKSVTDFQAQLGCTPAGFRTLASAPWWRQLQRLSLTNQRGESGWQEALVGLPPCPLLHSLKLHERNAEGHFEPRFLARSEAFPRLTQLQWRGVPLGPEGLRVLTEESRWQLTSLDLYGAEVGTEGVRALVSSPLAQSLRDLDLSHNGIDAEGAKVLASAPWASRLQRLVLDSNPIGSQGLLALASSPHLKDLQALEVGNDGNRACRVTSRDVLSFLRALEMPRLRHLRLSNLPIDIQGIEALGASPHFRNLTILSLSKAAIGDREAETLLRSPNVQGLVSLNLDWNKIKTGVAPLADPAFLPRLKDFWWHPNPIKQTLVEALEKRFDAEL